MSKKYTNTLSKKELDTIEKLILKHGNVVDFDMIYQILGKSRKKQDVRNFVSNLVKKGWLIRIKKGVFAISTIAGRGTIELSQIVVAQIIDHESYVSFEASLQHHGLFDQYLKVISSVGGKRTYVKKFKNWEFEYIKHKEKLFSGFKEYNIDGYLVKISTKEKAILDFLIYKRTSHNVDLVIEKLNLYKSDLDIENLVKLSEECSLSVKRSLGFIMDKANINTDKLYKLVRDNKNHSFLTSSSDKFNAKWRIYVDKYFVNN